MSDTLTAVRAKYPAYADVPDDTLAEALGDKYPVYRQGDTDFNREYLYAKGKKLNIPPDKVDKGRVAGLFSPVEPVGFIPLPSRLLPSQIKPEEGLEPVIQQIKEHPERGVISSEDVPTGQEISETTGLPKPVGIGISAVDKLAAGVAGFMTSPSGATQVSAAETPAAPVIFAKWAYDMFKGGVDNAKVLVDGVKQKIFESINKGFISANNLPAKTQNETDDDFAQRMAEAAVNSAFMFIGGTGMAGHTIRTLAKPKLPLAPATEQAVKTQLATPPKPALNIQDVVPSIETMTGELKPADKGASHDEAIEKHDLTTEDINKRTYQNVKTGEEVTPEQLEAAGVPTAHEQGKTDRVDRVHSDALAEAQNKAAGVTPPPSQSPVPAVTAVSEEGAVPPSKPVITPKPKETQGVQPVFDSKAGPFTVEYGTRSQGNKTETFDDLGEAIAFSKKKARSADFSNVSDANGNEMPAETGKAVAPAEPAKPVQTKATPEPKPGMAGPGSPTIKSPLSAFGKQYYKTDQGEWRQKGKPSAKVNASTVDALEALVKRPVTTPISRGPGAAAGGEPGTYSPIQRMADELRVTADKTQPIDAQIGGIEKLKAYAADTKDSLKRSMASLVAVKDAIWEKYTGLPEYGDEQQAVGKWFYALQRADFEARDFAHEITKAVPTKLRLEAITNWIQTDGDEGLLRERAAASKGSLKQGYEAAANLTEREKEIANMLRDYYDTQLQKGIQEGILKAGLKNYITQVWQKENPITKRLISDLAHGKLSKNFRYARKRIFDSYFEGEQAGYKPNKDAGFLVANYDQAFNKALAARAFIKDLHEGKASDGRPLVEISGYGKTIGEDEGNPTVLINPHAKPEDLQDYRSLDHPALQGWKWATKTPEGQNVFVKGDMIVHPEAYQKLYNRLAVSKFRQNPVTRAVLSAQTGIKQTMMSLSGFHQVQETLHALGHRVNPVNLPTIDFSEPVTEALSKHGLQLADYNALESFSEGLQGGGLLTKIPGIGPKLQHYTEWLFQDYIPRLKLQMAKLTLERNRSRYPAESEDKLLELSANEANAAFGELPYRYWGRSPTLQDALRTFVLAPDFLEARSRFVGRAAMPHGREQLIALGILAGTQYITARIMNQVLNNDPHWEMKNAFRIVTSGHAYQMRTVPGDMLHLFTDSRGFFYNRMSPMLRTATEAITGRDDRGIKRDLIGQVKDAMKMPVPISIKPRLGQRWWETFLNSFGVQEQRWDATQTINNRATEWKKANKITDTFETVYDPEADKYARLRMAVENDNREQSQAEYDKLKATIKPADIKEHFKRALTKPFTGSKLNETKFKGSLTEQGKEEYKEAVDLRQARLKMIQSLH